MRKSKSKKNGFVSFVFSCLCCIILAALACIFAFRISLSAPDSKASAKSVRVEIPSGTSIQKIAEILVGEGLIMELLESGLQEYAKVSVPEGLTIRKVAALLEKKDICSAQDFIAAACNPVLLEKYSVPAESFEGFLFPDTYFFNPSMNPDDVIERLVDNFFARDSVF